uniref:phospholipase A2 n=1 Tax=Esox lucius TaxID=8010 RepID=A0A3P8YJ55_ESOLU
SLSSIQQFILCVSLFSLLSTHDVKMSTGTDAQSIFCHKTSATGVGHTLISFLRNVVGSQTLLLYVSKWSKNQPVKCSINEDLLATSSYLTLCRQTHSESPVELSHFNISKLLSPGNLCSLSPVNGFSTQPESDILEQHLLRAKSRRKRALIFPGTLWCGTGSKAIDYHQLGMFERADRCCREHDHCGSIIPSFTVNYGVFNSNFFTVSHCECDQRFRQCLQSVNDSISNMVGFSFFNLLRVPCFEFTPKSQCIELNWWGISETTYLATSTSRLKPSPQSQKTSLTITTALPKHAKAPHGCRPRAPPRGDSFQTRQWRGRRGKACLEPTASKPPSPTNMSLPKKTASVIWRTTFQTQNTIPVNETTSPPVITTPTHWNNTCKRHLDDCKYKIPPLEKRYDLHNVESKTVYHCDCTRR